jgi:hypothetical protein
VVKPVKARGSTIRNTEVMRLMVTDRPLISSEDRVPVVQVGQLIVQVALGELVVRAELEELAA